MLAFCHYDLQIQVQNFCVECSALTGNIIDSSNNILAVHLLIHQKNDYLFFALYLNMCPFMT